MASREQVWPDKCLSGFPPVLGQMDMYVSAKYCSSPDLALQVSGPIGASIAALKLLSGTISYYHLVIQLPATFYGQRRCYGDT